MGLSMDRKQTVLRVALKKQAGGFYMHNYQIYLPELYYSTSIEIILFLGGEIVHAHLSR